MKLLKPNDYQAQAHSVFERIARELIRLIPAARIEHVGASSVPGAISKGDLDIYVAVPQSSHADSIEKLKAVNYVVKSNTLRTSELCMLVAPGEELDVALQVVAIDGEGNSGIETPGRPNPRLPRNVYCRS